MLRGGKWVNPAKLNPYRLKVRKARQLTDAEKDAQAPLGWAILDSYFKGGGGR